MRRFTLCNIIILMPRLSRQNIINQSQVFHAINRGILRQEIFHDEQDIFNFLNILKRYKEKAGFKVYHWCIMPNHYHLLLEFQDGNLLSKIIGACQQVYASFYHRKYSTAGKLFQNRFKSQAIEKDSYFLSCGRYIELNPVRAALVKYPWEWKWSSAAYYALRQKDDIVSVNEEFRDFYSDMNKYKEWLLERKSSETEAKVFKSSINIVGSDHFRKRHSLYNGHAISIRRGRPRKENAVATNYK